jgi:hypothetical protein
VQFALPETQAARYHTPTTLLLGGGLECLGRNKAGPVLPLEGSRLTIKTPVTNNPYTGQEAVFTLVFEWAR